jgi:hypothetical protein
MAKRSQPSSKREPRARPETASQAGALEVIVKVRQANYVPDGVKVRAQISPVLFTSVIPPSALEDIEKDPNVESVSVSQTLRTIG